MRVDHLVYATPDLDRTIDDLEGLLGVRATPGGAHPWGTRNALIGLGDRVYLEIIGPDPAQPAPAAPRIFGIDTLTEARLVTWAAPGEDLPSFVTRARSRGVDLGAAVPGRRTRADGGTLEWTMTNGIDRIGDGLVPFFIDWGRTPHPAGALDAAAWLVEMRAEHPDPARVIAALDALDLDLPVTEGPRPVLIAVISVGDRRVTLKQRALPPSRFA